MNTIKQGPDPLSTASVSECERPVFRWTEDSRIVRGCEDKGEKAPR